MNRAPARRGAKRIGSVLVVVLAGCTKAPPPTPPPTPEVEVLDVQPADTPFTIEFVGVTSSSQQVEVRARVNGFLEERVYEEGTLVQEGDVMFRLDQKPFQAQLDAAQAALQQQLAQLETYEANLERVRPLAAANAVSQKELDDSQGRVNSSAAAVEMARADVETAKLNLGYTTIYAPVSGASSYARIQVGAYLDALSSPLTYVAQLDPMWADFSVSEDQLLTSRAERSAGRVRFPEQGKAEVQLLLADGSLYPEVGRIFFQDTNYSVETGTFLLRATFPNPEAALRPGQFVRVHVLGAIRPDAIVVPQKAVLQGANGFFVWIVDEDGKAATRNVEVGPWQNDSWFIVKGLAAGDKVVTDGIIRLASGVPVKVVEGKTKQVDQPQGNVR